MWDLRLSARHTTSLPSSRAWNTAKKATLVVRQTPSHSVNSAATLNEVSGVHGHHSAKQDNRDSKLPMARSGDSCVCGTDVEVLFMKKNLIESVQKDLPANIILTISYSRWP